MFTIYSADVTGNPGNCSYPHKHVILDEASLKEGICHDYVCAEYRNSYRNGDNFIGSDCLPVDCDNDHTEDPAGWKTPEDVMEAFPGVTFAIHYSRFHMREKNGKPARPKFHVLFPIDYITDAALYSDMKKLINSIFPYFDTKALDAARFFFGTNAADVAIYPGRMTLTEFLEEDAFDGDLPDGQYDGNTVIPEGSRNATMSRFAGRVMAGAREHSPEDFITKITSVTPGSKGQQIWQDCLDLIFQRNQELIDYVQMICGLAAIGKVYVEALIIAYGDGRNGKSTFWNAISRVLGLYSGNISADTLTVGCRRNIKPEMAEVKGKRLLIAAEMQEGARLNDSTVKQLCSTDDVFAEKKYKDPFSFKPCHTLVLYTNHLPRVSASDDGIWRRLIVIPFNAKITGKSDIKNYGEYLYDNAGESILAWVIEGAKKVIELEYQIPVPKCVQDAICEYRSQNDWFGHFIEDKCDTGDDYKESSSSLYQAYRNYCIDTNEYVRSTADFYFALESAGFERVVLNRKRYFKGLRIRTEDDAGDDFLT